MSTDKGKICMFDFVMNCSLTVSIREYITSWPSCCMYASTITSDRLFPHFNTHLLVVTWWLRSTPWWNHSGSESINTWLDHPTPLTSTDRVCVILTFNKMIPCKQVSLTLVLLMTSVTSAELQLLRREMQWRPTFHRRHSLESSNNSNLVLKGALYWLYS